MSSYLCAWRSFNLREKEKKTSSNTDLMLHIWTHITNDAIRPYIQLYVLIHCSPLDDIFIFFFFIFTPIAQCIFFSFVWKVLLMVLLLCIFFWFIGFLLFDISLIWYSESSFVLFIIIYLSHTFIIWWSNSKLESKLDSATSGGNGGIWSLNSYPLHVRIINRRDASLNLNLYFVFHFNFLLVKRVFFKYINESIFMESERNLNEF